MPLPLFLIAGAIVAGGSGLGLGIAGTSKMVKTNKRMKEARERDQQNMNRFKKTQERTSITMDELGKLELDTLSSFKEFSELFERIKNKPDFKDIKIDRFKIPTFSHKELEKVYVGAGALISGLGGAALGTAGGLAASGATTAAVMALGTASTGTAISSLSGAALTNATLAALGGGSLAAGGGGVALGTTVLGAATAGVGILVGGAIFFIAGSSMSKKADKSVEQVAENEAKIDRICDYLDHLNFESKKYYRTLDRVKAIYDRELAAMKIMVNEKTSGKTNGIVDWHCLTKEEQLYVENTVMLVGVLYNMCKVNLVIKSKEADGLNSINYVDINKAEDEAQACLEYFKAA